MGKLFDRLTDMLADFSALVIAFIALSVCADVIARYVFGRPIAWTVDVTGYLQLYAAFFAAASVLRHGGHVRLDAVVDRLGPSARKGLDALANLIGLFTTGVIFCFSLSVTWHAFVSGTPVLKAVEAPKWLVLLPIPVGSFLLTVEFARRLLPQARGCLK